MAGRGGERTPGCRLAGHPPPDQITGWNGRRPATAGAQLRFTDIDWHRFTCFATGTRKGQLADLELRHRRRARCEDPIRCAKDTGLRNLPLKGRHHPAEGSAIRLTSQDSHCDQEGETTRARGTPSTRRDSRAASHGPTLKISGKPAPRASSPGSRKVEVSDTVFGTHRVTSVIQDPVTSRRYKD